MQVIKTIESEDSFAERSAKDWEMKTRLSILLNSFINIEVMSESLYNELIEIAEHFDLQFTLEKIKDKV